MFRRHLIAGLCAAGASTSPLLDAMAETNRRPQRSGGYKDAIASYVEEWKEITLARCGFLQDGLDGFKHWQLFPSKGEARADYVGTVINAMIDEVADLAPDAATLALGPEAGPLVKASIGVVKAAIAERERSRLATAGYQVRDFIRPIRERIDSIKYAVSQRDRLETLEARLHEAYREARDRKRYLDQLEAHLAFLSKGMPDARACEAALFEAFINCHYTGHEADGTGYIRYVYNYTPGRVGEMGFQKLIVVLPSPYDSRSEDGLNRLIKTGSVSRLRLPIDLRVRKQAVFAIDDFKACADAAKPSPSCKIAGWLDQRNRPDLDDADPRARPLLQEIGWRQQRYFRRT